MIETEKPRRGLLHALGLFGQMLRNWYEVDELITDAERFKPVSTFVFSEYAGPGEGGRGSIITYKRTYGPAGDIVTSVVLESRMVRQVKHWKSGIPYFVDVDYVERW